VQLVIGEVGHGADPVRGGVFGGEREREGRGEWGRCGQGEGGGDFSESKVRVAVPDTSAVLSMATSAESRAVATRTESVPAMENILRGRLLEVM
jgi:hypothetical protein